VASRVTTRRISLTLAATAVLGGLSAAAPASASTGSVYVSVPAWLGNCPHGGSPVGVWGTTGPYGELWSTPAGGDWGDDLVYARVRIGTRNTFTFKAFCQRPWYRGGSYWGPASQQTAHVSRVNQTVWTGPWGIRTN
jgi:hypothetical protein